MYVHIVLNCKLLLISNVWCCNYIFVIAFMTGILNLEMFVIVAYIHQFHSCHLHFSVPLVPFDTRRTDFSSIFKQQKEKNQITIVGKCASWKDTGSKCQEQQRWIYIESIASIPPKPQQHNPNIIVSIGHSRQDITTHTFCMPTACSVVMYKRKLSNVIWPEGARH